MTRQQGIFTADASAFLEREVEVEVNRLAPNVWAATCGSHRSVFAAARSSVVVLNTLHTPAATRALRTAIAETVPDKPLRTLVATIDHLDYSGYGQSLGPIEEVVAHELTAAMIQGRSAPGQLPATRIVRENASELEVDGLNLRLTYPGPTMGTGNIGVHLVDADVLYVVGLQSGARYALFPDVHFEQYVASMRALLATECRLVAPGRSAVMSWADARRAIAYVEDVQNVCQQALAAGIPIWLVDVMYEFCAKRLRPTWGHLDGFEEHIGIGAIRVVNHYLMGGWGLEDTQEPELLLKRARAGVTT